VNIAVFFEAPLVIQVHALAAIGAFVVGLIQMLAPKGVLPHRMMGYLFVVLMVTVASTAVFIRHLNNGNFSIIHIFVPLTFFSLFGLVRNAMSGNGHEHGRAAKGLFFAALMIPGLFAFMPGRLMWAVISGGW